MFPPQSKTMKKNQANKLNKSSMALYNALNVKPATQGPTPLSAVSQGHGSHLAMLLNKDVPFRPANYTPIIPSKSLQAKRENRAIMEEAMQQEDLSEYEFETPAFAPQGMLPPQRPAAPSSSHLANLLNGTAAPRPANFTPIIPSRSNQQRRANNAMFQQVQELEKMAKQLERAAKEAKLDAKRRKQQGKALQTKHMMMWSNRVPLSIKTSEMIFDDVSSVTASVRSS